jgi:hypothetical protein
MGWSLAFILWALGAVAAFERLPSKQATDWAEWSIVLGWPVVFAWKVLFMAYEALSDS